MIGKLLVLRPGLAVVLHRETAHGFRAMVVHNANPGGSPVGSDLFVFREDALAAPVLDLGALVS